MKYFPLFTAILSFASYGNNADSIFELSLAELGQLSVVTAASGFEQKSREAPANVTVINAEEWQAMGARTLAEVLRSVPGFHLSKEFQYDHNIIILRGLSGNSSSKIKFLIDGEPMAAIQDNGGLSGFHMPLTSFKRIEVVMGPGSAVYGADAFAGIINLVSYEHHEMAPSIGFRVGSFDSYEINGRHAFELGASKFQWSFDYLESEDDKGRIIQADLQSTLDAIFGTSASNAPGRIDEHYRIFSGLAKWQWHNLSVEYFTWRNFDLGLAAGIAQALDTKGRSSNSYSEYRLNYDFSELVTGDLELTLSYKDQQTNSYLYVFPAGTVLPIGADGNIDFVNPTTVTLFTDGYIGTPSPYGDTKTLRVKHLIDLTSQHKLRWELGYEEQRYRTREKKNFGPGILSGTELVVDGQLTDVTGTPYIYLPDVDRDFYYLSLQDEWHVNEQVQLSLGARYDHYSDFGSTFNPRVGFIWQMNDKLALKLFAGSAFQSPSVEQLYARNNPVGLGNPELKPETVDTLESGINVEYFVNDNALLSMSLFNFHAKDLVEFVYDEQRKGNVAQNIGEQKGRGGELVFKWKPIKEVTFNANYSLLSIRDGNDVQVANVPRQMAYLGMNWQLSDVWQWNLDAKWVGERTRAVSDTRDDLAGYTWLSSKITRHNLIEGVTASLIINNALDKAAKEPSNGSVPDDYPLAGRQILLEFDYQF